MELREYLNVHKITITDFAKESEFSREFINLLILGRRRVSPRAAKLISSFTNGEVSVREILSLNKDELITGEKRKKSVAENEDK